MAETKKDQYHKQLAQLEALKQEAIAELESVLQAAQEHVERVQAELDELTGGTGTRGGKKPLVKTAKRVIDPNKPCSICGFATVPNHDARKHRAQEEKKAFTAKELSNLGLQKA